MRIWKWIKNFHKKQKEKKEYIQLLQEEARLLEEDDEEIKTLLHLEEPICGKHHG